MARGWIEELLTGPSYHFTYPGFDWVAPLGTRPMYAVFCVMGASALAVAFGWRTRTMAAVYFLTFTYVELIDKATYLNHYYLVSLLAFLLVLFPCDAALSVTAGRHGTRGGRVPLLHYWIFRVQIGLVYLFAGLAKLNGDWLLRAEPLAIWLPPRADVFPLLAEPWVAYVMSWCGMLFDLSARFCCASNRLASWRTRRSWPSMSSPGSCFPSACSLGS